MSGSAMAVKDVAKGYAITSTHATPPEGYKRTELGVIPVAWECAQIETLGNGKIPPIKAGPFGSSLTKDQYVADGYKVYGQEQVIRGNHLYGDYFISEKKYRELESCSVKPGDILLSLVGTLGKLLEIPSDAVPGVINPRLLRISLDKERVISRFFKYLFESSEVQSRLASQAQGGTMGVLNAGVLKSFFIQLPSITEQRAIATALSDVDALLEELDRLIAKKRDLKQATMQQLLTGQTRLPGFGGAWEIKRIGEVLEVRHGRDQKEVETPDGQHPILASGGEIGRSNTFIYDKPSVLIGRKGTIDAPQYMDQPFWTVDTLFYTELIGKNSAKFMYYKFCMIPWRKYNEASGVPSLSAKTIEKIEITTPSPEEQSAIAEVLSDFDNGLQVLEQRRAKISSIKQAMMQELLTGRTRLI